MKGALCLVLAAVLTLAAAPASCSSIPDAADERDQTVRVLLTRLAVTDRIDAALACAYTLAAQSGAELRFSAGAEVSVLLRGGRLYVHHQGMSLNAGTRLTLSRAGGGGERGWRRANFAPLYAGDLTLYIEDGAIRPVLSIDVEDYLLGVVPYEMSESYPMEALKAQAVAARTYALRKQGARDEYDVVDTSNDQVYRGWVAGNANTERAVAETRGVCGFHEGKLALCYYSASNGGQTERTQTVWPGGEELPYYAFGTDKYDVENPGSTVKSIVIPKSYKKDEIAPYGLRKLLASQLETKLSLLGYDPAPASIRVDKVLDVSVDAPKGDKGSKLMTMFHIKLRVSGRTSTGAHAGLVDLNDEEVSLFAEATPTPDAQATPEPPPTPTPAPSYGPFTALDEAVTIDAAIFPTVEKAFSMNISPNFDNELWTVKETGAAFTVEARRFGHGAGMSQRGAQWMAEKYKMTYEKILAFYYPGMALARFGGGVTMSVSEDAALAEDPGPAPSPTPRPTLMPVSEQPQEGQWLAEVSGIDDDSSLNLRAEPDAGADIVMRLFKYQKLLVTRACEEDGWLAVRTDAVEGYVMEKFLSPID